MSEFEDKLGSILSNQDAMAQIMALAQSIGSPGQSAAPPQAEPSPPPVFSAPAVTAIPAPPSAPPSLDIGSIMGALGSVDPQLIQTGMQLFSEFAQGDDQKTALLMALRPFLKEERYAKVDRAVQIARLSRVLRVAFQLFKGRGGGEHV